MSRASFPVVVARVRQLTPRVREYLLASADGTALPSYTAGAHAALHMVSPERGLMVRHYSLIGGDGLQDDAPDTWRIAVQREDRARGSAFIHACFDVGTRLEVAPPSNNFPLDRRDGHVLLLAGGIGVTPMHAMARSLVRRHRPFAMFYAGRNAQAMAYHDALAALCGERIVFHYSDSQGAPDLEAVLRAQPEGTRVYVCGPGPMIEATHAAAARMGWDADRVRSETFGAGSRPGDEGFDVTLRRTGRTVHVGADVSILDALTAEGLHPLADCRRGECGLCPLPVVAAGGRIDHRDRFLTDTEKAANESLCICVSRLCGGGTLVLDA